MTTDPDRPDDHLGVQDPFVHAVTIWKSLEALRVYGSSEGHCEGVARSMDAVLIRHRQVLVTQYLEASPTGYQDSIALRRKLGLEYWSDGKLLDRNDPDRKTS